MNQSIWLNKHVEEVQGKRDKNAQSKKVILIIVPVFFMVVIMAALAGNDAMDSQMKMGIMAMFGVFIAIMVFAIIMIGKGKKIDATRGTRESVIAMLKTDEEVQLFDIEMSATPLREIIVSGTSKFFITENFVGVSFMLLGDLQYRFAKKSDVAGMDFYIANGRDVYFDIMNYRGEKIFGEVAPNMNKIEEIIMLLRTFNPELILRRKQ